MFAKIGKTIKSIYYILVLVLAPVLCIVAIIGFLKILSPLFASGSEGDETATQTEAETTEALVSDEELISKQQEAMDDEELSQSDVLAENRSEWTGDSVKVVIVPAQNILVVYGVDHDGYYTVPLYVMLCSVGKLEAGEYKIAERYTWKKTEYTSDDGPYERWNHYDQIFGDYEIGSTNYTDTDPSTLTTQCYNMLGSSSSGKRVYLSDYDARVLYQICAEGTAVEVKDAETELDFVIPTKTEIGEKCYWDPTNNSQLNPWYTAAAGTISVSAETITVERGETVNYYRYVLAMDEEGNAANGDLAWSGEVDIKTVGEYTVTYTLTLADGSEAQNTITYVVEDTTGPEITYPLNVNVVCDEELISLKNTKQQIADYIESQVTVTDLGREISLEDANYQLNFLLMGSSLTAGYQRFEITATDSYGNETTVKGRVYILERQNADLMIDASDEVLETTTPEETTTEETTEETTQKTTTEKPTTTTQKSTTTQKPTTTTQKQTTTTEKPTTTTQPTTTTTQKPTTTTQAETETTTTTEEDSGSETGDGTGNGTISEEPEA